ncbi:hypothetical protein F443_05774 [Phytophthora nicotianae P1569]|uniref:Uncharacterized protein n=1 Tax=Phytophthora nicotianae P1569 TaxID=1317065 RepID=V9FIZ3_PHYNI|nr:hypothetical protein F443_05774 [Phytophthora nicotianae P1569]
MFENERRHFNALAAKEHSQMSDPTSTAPADLAFNKPVVNSATGAVSGERDDSGDETFTADSETDGSEIELQSQESASSENGGEADIGIYLMDGDLRSQVTEIIMLMSARTAA